MTTASTVRPEGAYLELRRALLAGEEAPGSAITESAVAARFGISRPTARLAIERLVAEGLLSRSAHHAARVPALSRADILDLFANRATLEAAASAALAGSGAIPTEAHDAQRRLLALAPDGEFAAIDLAFHRALVTGQPSPRLARLHALLMGEIELCIAQVQARHLISATEIAAQHQAILDAIAAADPERAASVTRAHIEGARDRLLAQYDTAH